MLPALPGLNFSFLQTAHNLCNIYVKLKELGHPMYLDRNFEDKLECSVASPVAAEKVFSIHAWTSTYCLSI